MAQTARCPSCGAPVEFKSAASILAVCDYCQSTLIRHGEDLENLGKMAALIEDKSPLQRGAEGRWRGRHFGLIGRIQIKYEQGLWNEWHLLFDDGKSGWLSEAGGEYVISEPQWLAESLPRFEELQPGGEHLIDGRAYTVSNVETAECVAGEGELPFKVGAGYPAPVADLRDEQGRFATLDYSDDPAKPLLFVGESVDLKSLAWANLRQGVPLPKVTVNTRAFNCPSCGAPLKVAHENIETVGCGSCGALLDPGDERIKILATAKSKQKVAPLLELGSKGSLRGEMLEVIGFMRRRMQADGIDYFWSEYLLLGPDNRQRWLTDSDGHWNLAQVLPRTVKAVGGMIYEGGREYKHFQSYPGHVDYVIGEFPWRVRLDEVAQVEDYVAPPFMLSKERSAKEVTWTLGEYIDADEVREAFKPVLPLRRPSGAYANQPNPYEERHRRVCRRFWQFAGIALAIHFLLLVFGPGGKVLTQPMMFTPDDDEPRLTSEFVLDGKTNRIELIHDTSVDNNWVGLNATLVNKDTGENWQAAREVSYYSGVDGGDSWSEGSRNHEVVFADLPPGHYLLAIESDMDDGSPPVNDRLTIARAGPRWSSLVLVILFLIAFPIYTRVRKGSFEVRRWAESDHPIVTTDSAGDDD
jgi:hypothetical protein